MRKTPATFYVRLLSSNFLKWVTSSSAEITRRIPFVLFVITTNSWKLFWCHLFVLVFNTILIQINSNNCENRALIKIKSLLIRDGLRELLHFGFQERFYSIPRRYLSINLDWFYFFYRRKNWIRKSRKVNKHSQENSLTLGTIRIK